MENLVCTTLSILAGPGSAGAGEMWSKVADKMQATTRAPRNLGAYAAGVGEETIRRIMVKAELQKWRVKRTG